MSIQHESLETPPCRILVTGDFVCDWNLVRPDNTPEGYFDGSAEAQLHIRPGGAWYLSHLLQRVTCADLAEGGGKLPKVEASEARAFAKDLIAFTEGLTPNRRIAHAHSVWSMHDRLTGDKARKDDKVWHIDRLVGCQSAELATEIAKSETQSPPPRPKTELLVIDDLNLGYSSDGNRAAWEADLALCNQGHIVLKHGVRKSPSALFRTLAETCAERLTVVVSASTLRQRNAALSQALSWDQVLEDIEAEFATGPSSRDLARVKRAVIHFGLAGAVVFEGGRLKTFVFHPEELEGAWELQRVVEIFEANDPEKQPNYAGTLNNLALLLQATNRLTEAEPLMRRAVEILVKFAGAVGHPHPRQQLFGNNYKSLLQAMGHSEEQILTTLRQLAPEFFRQ